MKLDDVQIVLVNPDESRNIGSACRAMKAMGCRHLRIVGEKAEYSEELVKILSVHSFDVWQDAQFFGTLGEAVADCSFVAGTTRRRGKYRKMRLIYPDEMAKFAAKQSGKVAVVFGNERTGLSDEDLNVCNVGVEIPGDKKFGSLNLSHAVQVVCTYLFREASELSPSFSAVGNAELAREMGRVCDELVATGFFRLGGRDDMENFLRDILARAAVTDSELRRFAQIFCKMSGRVRKAAASCQNANGTECLARK